VERFHRTMLDAFRGKFSATVEELQADLVSCKGSE
jgi:hypothetical protein